MFSDKIDNLVKSLQQSCIALFQRIDNNLLKSSSDKGHFLINSNKNITVKTGEFEIEKSNCETFFGVELD